MDIQINEDYMLTILKALYGEFISTKQYFENHKNSNERIGIISPKEYKEIYNDLLNQSHDQGELLELNLINS
jgi:hypothetical protein